MFTDEYRFALVSLVHDTVIQESGSKKEIGTLGCNDNYDFNNQYFSPIHRVLKPGDQLETVCVYDTATVTQVTPGCGGVDCEMCLNYIVYYPKIPSGFDCLDDHPVNTNITLSDC